MPKDSTVKDLDDLFSKAKAARAKLEPEWYLCLAYYAGNQWVAWGGDRLFRPPMPKNRITVVDNRIQPIVRKELARMTKSRPVFTVTPNTSDEADRNAAEVGEHLLRYLWKHLNLSELTFKALQWSRICTAGFLKCYWDSSVGDSVEVLVGQRGQVLTGPSGVIRPGSPEAQIAHQTAVQAGQQLVVKEIRQGDLKVEVRSPFQMFPDPLADTFDECEWLIEESVKSVEYVKRRYNVDVQADTVANPALIEAKIGPGAIFMPGGGSYKGVKIREYWSKPSSTHPSGRRAVWVTKGNDSKNNRQAGQLLFEDDRPFDPFPYVMLSGIPIPGRLWPTSVAEALRGPQTELNKVKSQIAENRNRVGNPSIVASMQAVKDPDKFAQSTTMPGGIIWIDDIGSPNAAPQILQAPPLPAYVVEEIQRIEESMQEISGQHEVTSAQVPPGVTAASAINLLQESDDTMLGPSISDYERQIGKLGQKLLQHCARYYTDARTVKLAGDNGAWQIFDFRGSMLRENTHVEVQAGSAFPQSKAAKQAAAQDLLTFFVQSGNPPHGRQLAQFLKDWEVGAADRLIEEYTADETQVNRENLLLSQGQPLQINQYDNDQAHIDGHTDFQKQATYQKLPPNAQQVFEQHVALHRQRLAGQQQAQMQLQMQMEGKGQPGQPAPGGAQSPDGQNAQATLDLHGQGQQQQLQNAQLQQQTAQQAGQYAQQQGFSQSQQEQQQRHAEEQHRSRLQLAEEAHHARLQHQQEQHEMRLRQMQQQGPNQNKRAA